jgi:Lrp/AsnC family leucine-responsive transcriptional regulator
MIILYITIIPEQSLVGDSMLDRTDLAILELLQANARTSNADIARRIDMAPSAILDRIRKLEQRGIIRGYTARIDPAAVGLGLTAFILVRTEERIGRGTIGDALAKIPEVLEVHHVAGEDCYLVKARARDTQGLSRLLQERFGRLRGVRNTRSTIVLSTVKEVQALPLPKPESTDHGA